MNFILVCNVNNIINECEFLNTNFVINQLSSFIDTHCIDRIYDLRPINKKYVLEDIRRFVDNANYTSNEYKQKIFIIYNFELFTEIHQNFILKILEENKHVFVLLTNSIHKVLPTVISRCIVVYTQIDQELNQNNIDVNSSLFLNQIKAMIKNKAVTREEVLDFLSKVIISFRDDNFNDILTIDKSIKLLEANCSVKSVLYYLFDYLVTRNKYV